jgi:hypothetical protein
MVKAGSTANGPLTLFLQSGPLSPKEGKMRDLIEVIKDYQRSDSANRLNLFLAYPQLRGTFIEIDQNEKQPVGPGKMPSSRVMASIRSGCRALASLFM